MLIMIPHTKKGCYIFHEINDRNLMSVEIIECGTHDCGENEQCTNNAGSLTCTCKEGFEGDGKTCQGNNRLILATYQTRMRSFFLETKSSRLISCLLYGFLRCFCKPVIGAWVNNTLELANQSARYTSYKHKPRKKYELIMLIFYDHFSVIGPVLSCFCVSRDSFCY